MRYRIKPRYDTSIQFVRRQQVYHVQFKEKWWHKWKFVRRGTLETQKDDDFPTVWYSRAGAQTYINQQINTQANEN